MSTPPIHSPTPSSCLPHTDTLSLQGQIFFDEALNTEVLAQPAYQGTGQQHTYNSQDGILAQANQGGYSAFADIERLGDSLDDGLLYVYFLR